MLNEGFTQDIGIYHERYAAHDEGDSMCRWKVNFQKIFLWNTLTSKITIKWIVKTCLYVYTTFLKILRYHEWKVVQAQ